MTMTRDERIERAKYRVGNPSAWENYDEEVSEDLRAVLDRLSELEAMLPDLRLLLAHKIGALNADVRSARAALLARLAALTGSNER